MAEANTITVETTSIKGVVVIKTTTTTTMSTAVIRATQTATKIMATTTATTTMATATATQMATTTEKTIRKCTAGRMYFVLTWEELVELLLMDIKPMPLGPTTWAAVGATSDPLDRYRQ